MLFQVAQSRNRGYTKGQPVHEWCMWELIVMFYFLLLFLDESVSNFRLSTYWFSAVWKVRQMENRIGQTILYCVRELDLQWPQSRTKKLLSRNFPIHDVAERGNVLEMLEWLESMFLMCGTTAFCCFGSQLGLVDAWWGTKVAGKWNKMEFSALGLRECYMFVAIDRKLKEMKQYGEGNWGYNMAIVANVWLLSAFNT